ncbi:unnamed protein product [Rotaria sp. Silwood1]|nr:unnamed protein product [Rotaria sp. Silwood1]
MGLPFGYQQSPTSFFPEQFGSNAFNSQDRTQFYQSAQSRSQSLSTFFNPYPQASGPFTPGQLPSSSSRLQQDQQPSNTFQPFGQGGGSQDKTSRRHSKKDDTQSQRQRQTPVIAGFNANTGQALKEPPKTHGHREHQTVSGINSQEAVNGSISSSVQPLTIIRETTRRKQSPQQSRPTSHDPSPSNGSQAATTDTAAKKQQNQHEETAAQSVNAAVGHANNRQVAVGVGSDVQHQVSAAVAPPLEEIDNIMPTKLFDGTRTSLRDLDQAACSYLWFRRIKEIFLVIGDQTDAFSCSDMTLARDDMIETCEQYLANTKPQGGGTNLDEGISLEYANQKLKHGGDFVVVMYEITIDPAIPCSAFADIESISFHPREREVLFKSKSAQQHLALLYYNMGKVAYARPDYVKAKKNFDKSDQFLSNKDETTVSNDTLEKCLLEADLLIAREYLKHTQNRKHAHHRKHTHHHKHAQNRKHSAEICEKLQEALKIYESMLPSTHPKVAETRINIFYEYVDKRNFQLAIEYHENGLKQHLESYEKKYIITQQELANLYAIIGACFVQKHKFDDAMKMWKKGIQHEQKTFLDQLLSSARVSRIKLDTRLVQNAYRAAIDHYENDNKSDYAKL